MLSFFFFCTKGIVLEVKSLFYPLESHEAYNDAYFWRWWDKRTKFSDLSSTKNQPGEWPKWKISMKKSMSLINGRICKSPQKFNFYVVASRPSVMQYCSIAMQYCITFFWVLQKYCNTFLKLKYWIIAILFLSEMYCNTFLRKENNLEQNMSPFWINKLWFLKRCISITIRAFYIYVEMILSLVIIFKNYSFYDWIL